METERQYCRKCQTHRPIEAFAEGFLTCTRCRDKEKRRYDRERERLLEQKKEYREREKEHIREKQIEHFQSVKDIVITCPVCNYDIKKYKKAQHETSQFHQDNLVRQLNPDMEALPEPDEIRVINGKEQYYCYACKCSTICWFWKNHVQQQSHIEAIKKRNEAEKTVIDTIYSKIY